MQALPVGDRLEPGDHAQQRRLAAPRRADEHEELAVVQIEAHVLDGGVAGERLVDATQGYPGQPCTPRIVRRSLTGLLTW